MSEGLFEFRSPLVTNRQTCRTNCTYRAVYRTSAALVLYLYSTCTYTYRRYGKVTCTVLVGDCSCGNRQRQFSSSKKPYLYLYIASAVSVCTVPVPVPYVLVQVQYRYTIQSRPLVSPVCNGIYGYIKYLYKYLYCTGEYLYDGSTYSTCTVQGDTALF